MNSRREKRRAFVFLSKFFIGAVGGLVLSLFFFVGDLRAANNVVTDITYLDLNENGQIDRIQATIDNDSDSIVIIHDTSGWTVTEGDADIDILNVTLEIDSDTNSIIILIDLDESDPDLSFDTENFDLEVYYEQQGVDAGTEFDDEDNTQLTEINGEEMDLGDIENDGAAPIVLLSYSKHIAGAGIVTITARYSEAIVGTPSISIFQQGTMDIVSASMTDSGDQTIWTYDYMVVKSDGAEYLDGIANVGLSLEEDIAGNIAKEPLDTTFIIDTTAPVAVLTYSDIDRSFTKGQVVTITAIFNEPLADSPVVKLAIDNSELAAADMTKVSDTIYSYEYMVKAKGNVVDAGVTLSLGQDLAGNLISEIPTAGGTFNINNSVSSNGHFIKTICSSVVYSDWSYYCFNGVQYRNFMKRLPNNCSLTVAQYEDARRVCGAVASANTNAGFKPKPENVSFVEAEKKMLKNIDSSLSNRLSGKILLQVESLGEAWYVNPQNKNRYFLGRPDDAFNIMRSLGLGVSEKDYNSFNGVAPGRLSGRILLRVQAKGEAYYINPDDFKMHYLGRPQDAFNVMRNLGLGITNNDIRTINIVE